MSQPCSEGTLLDGRIIYRQPIDGYRTGLEPVLLAAAVPARAGERVVEAGTGAGAGLLALHARIPKLTGLGLERDAAMAKIAAANFAANAATGLHALCQAIEDWSPGGAYDHAFANPPWHRDDSTPPPNPGRRDAKRARQGLLLTWIEALAKPLRRRGTLSLILPAATLSEAAAALAANHCAEQHLLPLWPHQGEAAKLMILQAIKEGRGPCRILPGLTLHEADGRYTANTQAILRDGGGLEM